MRGDRPGVLWRVVLSFYPPRVRRAFDLQIAAALEEEWTRRSTTLTFVLWLGTDMFRARADEHRARNLGNRSGVAAAPRPAAGPPHGPHFDELPLRKPTRGLLMDTLARELRHAVRALVRRPGFALSSILTLALGIGATTAVFSVVDTVLLNPLPYPEPERLIVVAHVVPKIASGEWGLSQSGYFYFREHAETLEDIGAYWGTSRVITGDGSPERLQVTAITATTLSTLGVTPELGRPITAADDRPGAAEVVLLSHGLWVSSFGGDPGVVGSRILLSGDSYEVIGVMPESFRFPAAGTDAWLPSHFDPAATPINQHTFGGVARMRAGVTPEDVRTELQALVARFPEELPTAYGNGFIEQSGFQVVTRDLLEDTVGNVTTLLWIVLAAAVIVLVVACANVAHLMVLRAQGRRREVAVRAAMGASRAALLRYSLIEAAVPAVIGGVVGLAIAWMGVQLLVLAAPAGLSRIEEIGVRAPAALVALLAVVVVAAALGAVSTLRWGSDLSDELKSGGRTGSADRHRMRLRGAFVVTQVSMAVLLMAGSGVLLRSFFNLRAVDPGFSPDNVLTLQLSLSPAKYDDAAAFRFFDQVSERLRGLPVVTAVGAVTGLPLVSRASDNANGVADLPDGTEQTILMDTKFAGPGYFEALGMRLLEGRTFENRDMEAGNQGAIITRALADELWPGQSALGKRIRPLLTDFPWHTVVGVVDDVRTEDITRAPEPTVYFPYADLAWNRSFYFAVRTNGPPEPLLPAVRREVWALDADVPLSSVATMAELVSDHFSRTTFTLTLLGGAAAMALFLCAVGIYGVIGFAVSQRRFELGVRMALGARSGQVAGMVIGQTMLLAAVGIAVGIVLAFAGMGLMESLLFEVAPADPLTLFAVALGLAAVAALAGALPARGATRVDAVVALHGE